jgi:leader peptidase (prepilin peptidase)/N-methyltransferase
MDDSRVLQLSAALFGLIVGSFLNVCISRLPEHLSVVSPRSHCPACQHPIAWYDNIPVLSFFLLRTRCRYCGARISWRYLVVELATSLLFLGVVYAFGFSLETVKWLVFGCLMLTLAFTDAETQLLPDVLTIGGTFTGLLLSLMVASNTRFRLSSTPRQALYRFPSLSPPLVLLIAVSEKFCRPAGEMSNCWP